MTAFRLILQPKDGPERAVELPQTVTKVAGAKWKAHEWATDAGPRGVILVQEAVSSENGRRVWATIPKGTGRVVNSQLEGWT